jgi:hypothetical protein
MACCGGFCCAAGSWLAGIGTPLLLLLRLLLVVALQALLLLAVPLLSAACRTPCFMCVFDFCCFCWWCCWCWCCRSLLGCAPAELLLVVSELLPLLLAVFFATLLGLCLRLGQVS